MEFGVTEICVSDHCQSNGSNKVSVIPVRMRAVVSSSTVGLETQQAGVSSKAAVPKMEVLVLIKVLSG